MNADRRKWIDGKGSAFTRRSEHPRPSAFICGSMFLCVLVLSWMLICLSAAARAAEVTVFAAASLTDAFKEIGHAFERAHPGTKVTFSFAASSLLRTQIEQGAPADLFASADVAQMEPLVRAGK